MSGLQNLKQQILPLIKGLPVVAIVFFGFLFAAKKIINYTPNVYQTIAKIKLDDQKHGMSNNNLFSDFDVFSTENKITAEAEVLKSPILIEKALKDLKFDVIIYRVGQLKNTMLYDDSPIIVDYEFEDEKLFDQVYTLKVLDRNQFQLIVGTDKNGVTHQGIFGDTLKIGSNHIYIQKNDSLFQRRSVDLIGDYELRFLSKTQLIQYLSEKLDVKAVDKEIAILRVVFKEEHPKKAADFANALCEAYLNDYMETKSNAANLTVQFIDEQLKEVGRKLTQAERNLENFKHNNGVVNTTQETETGLREISKLKIQLIDLQASERAAKQVLFSINDDRDVDLSAIRFGFGDLLMTELVKKHNSLQDQRKEARLKYKENSENITILDEKIAEIIIYLKQAIQQNLIDIEIQRTSIELEVLESSRMFDDLPEREKNHQILEREFHLQEEVYNFLSQKKIEASIAANAMISFHRIIQVATTPKQPVSPNRILITFVMGLLGLIIGVAYIYLKKYFKARILSKKDIEKLTDIPVISVIRKGNKDYDFDQLAKGILLKNLVQKGQVISINSTLNKEGRSYVTRFLADAFSRLGHTVCLVEIGNKNNITTTIPQPKKDEVVKFLSSNKHSQNIELLKKGFDFVFIDGVPSAVDVTGVELMKMSTLNLYVFRANHTCHNYGTYAELLKEEYNISNLHIVLNDAHVASNYSGNFIGSRFQKHHKTKGLIAKVKYYYQTYLA